jgi:hypothetical protein
MHFRLSFPWIEAEAKVFMEEEDVFEDVLGQKINLKKQKTSESNQYCLHKIMAKDGQTNHKFNFVM